MSETFWFGEVHSYGDILKLRRELGVIHYFRANAS